MIPDLIPNLLEVSRALAQVVEALQLDGTQALREVRLGINESFPFTPACEVVAMGGPFELPSEGSGTSLNWYSWQLVLYTDLEVNTSRAEEELLPVAEALWKRLRDPDWDDTLGGLVQRAKPRTLELDVTIRNGRHYRTAAVEVVAGAIPPLHR